MRNKYTRVQILLGIAHILMIGSGVLALWNPGEKLVSIAIWLGLSMLIAGSINIIIYKRAEKSLYGAQWLLADGMVTILLSVFPLFNKMLLPAILPFFFGVWELFSGILKVIESRELEKEEIQEWEWFCGIGCIEILSGVAALLKPVEEFMGMHVVVAIIFFVQSCGFLFKIMIYPKITKEG